MIHRTGLLVINNLKKAEQPQAGQEREIHGRWAEDGQMAQVNLGL